jgi:mRNA-degrading endonuclease toxin of MazEF toxin-antitoxin module
MLSTWPGGSASCCEVDVGEAANLERYAVVVQANAYEHLPTWLVAPTTATRQRRREGAESATRILAHRFCYS